MDTATLKAILAAVLLAACTVSGESSQAAENPETRFIGYFDVSAQKELPIKALLQKNLTHVVLTGAVKVDNNGTFHYRLAEPLERSAQDLIRALAALPGLKLVVSLRGYPDDVALDELAEVPEARERFTTEAALLAREWGASGLEIEWHSDDPAGGKATAAPFDVMEQYHFALLCRDLASSLRASGSRSLSVAVRPGRQEFADGAFVHSYIDWLAIRAYSMRSLGDPHHSSQKDMVAALDEWSAKGVPNSQLVLSTPLFGRPGAALHTTGDRNEALRRTWRDLAHSGLRSPKAGTDARGDVFLDAETGKAWWVSGLNTTKAKVKYVLQNGYGGIAYRDLHHDSPEKQLSLVQAAVDSLKEYQEARKKRRSRSGVAPILFQKGMMLSRSDDQPGGAKHGEL